MEQYRNLIEGYVEGWKHNDETRILDTLDEGCIIIESHGPTYRGKAQVRAWFHVWLAQHGVVKQWDILSIYQTHEPDTLIFEWYFECYVSRRDYQIPGISVVKFTNGRIGYLHEYRMTNLAFDWDGRKLES